MPRKAGKRKMKGGRMGMIKPIARSKNLGEINAKERSNMMMKPSVPTMSTWERIKKFARDSKFLSHGLTAIGNAINGEDHPNFKEFFTKSGTAVSALGYGRKRKQKGGLLGSRLGYIGDPPNAPYMRKFKLSDMYVPKQSGSGKVVRF